MSVNVGRRRVPKTRIFRTGGAFFSLLMIGGMTAWALYNPSSPLVLQRPVTSEPTSHSIVLPTKTANHFRRSEEHLPAIETPKALIEQHEKQTNVPEFTAIEGVDVLQPMLDSNQQLELQLASMKQLESDRDAWLVAHRQQDWFKNKSTKTMESQPGSERENNASDIALVQPYLTAHQVVREHDAIAGKRSLAAMTDARSKTNASSKQIPPSSSVEVARLPTELKNFASTQRSPVEGDAGASIEVTDVPRFLTPVKEAALRPWESGQY